MKQSKNYKNLYFTNKKITEKNIRGLKFENEKLSKKCSDMESKLTTFADELEFYKNEIQQLEANKNTQKKFVMRPKRKLHSPTKVEEEKEVPKLDLQKLSTDKSEPKDDEKRTDRTSARQKISMIHQTPPNSSSTIPTKSSGAESDKSSQKNNETPLSIQPKTNTANTLKGPLKNYTKKSDSKKGEKVSAFAEC